MSETRQWPASVGLIGAGAMGRAFLAGLHRGTDVPATMVADAIETAAHEGAAECGGTVADIPTVAKCDLLILAVKPKDASAVLAQVREQTHDHPVLVSVVAGWDIARLRRELPGAAVVRTMPNLAVRHGAGVVATAFDGLHDYQRAAIDALLTPLGEVMEVDEALFAAATALAGSGPGLVALIAEALEEGGVRAGLSREQARPITRAVLAGVAALLEDGQDPAVLRQRVSSPAGTTIDGIAVLEQGAVRAHVADAVMAAARRAKEL